MTLTAAEIYRDYNTDGVPSSGVHKPVKADIRAYLADRVETEISFVVADRTALKAADHAATQLVFVNGPSGGMFLWVSGDFSDEVTADTLEGVYAKADDTAATSGAWVRIFDESIAPEWFGAVGDGITDDYDALAAAFSFAWTYGVALMLGAKTYITGSTITVASLDVVSGNKLTVRGHGRLSSVIAGSMTSGDVIQIGDYASTELPEYLEFIAFGVTAAAGGTPFSAINQIDLGRSTFRGMRLSGCSSGAYCSGGVSNLYDDCDFDGNETGFYAEGFASLASGGYPNYLELRNCRILNNTDLGVDFTAGRMLVLTGCKVYGNGTAGQPTDAGVKVGSDIGSEGALSYAYGAIIRDCWFEGNAGRSSVDILGGTNVVEDCYFVNNPDATYDIYIAGTAAYHIDRTQHDTAKTPHITDVGTTTSRNFLNGARKDDGSRANIVVPAARCYMPDLGVPLSKQITVVQGSTVALSNSSTAAQSIFASTGDVLAVEAATTYRFRAKLSFNTGAVTHTTAFGLGGTATFTSIEYLATAISSAVNTLAVPQMRRVTTASAAVLTATSLSVTTDVWIEGVMRINAVGTIIPQVTFSAGPTGTCEVAVNSFFELEPIGSNTVASVGAWS